MDTPPVSDEHGDGVSAFNKNWKPTKLRGGITIPHNRKTKDKAKHHIEHPKTSDPASAGRRCSRHRFIPNIPAVECGICYSPVKEATTPRCGHMFCHQCISLWSNVRSWCPICQDKLSPLIRIYSIDEQIEKYYLDEFSAEERAEYEAARTRRFEEQRSRAEQERGFLGRVRRKCFHLTLYFESKGFLRGIGRSFVYFWRWFKGPGCFSTSTLVAFFLGVLLTLLLVSLVSDFSLIDFIKYMYDAAKKYKGPGEGVPQSSTPFGLPRPCDPDDLNCNRVRTLIPRSNKRRLGFGEEGNLYTWARELILG